MRYAPSARITLVVLALMLLCSAISGAPEKRLSVYSTAANYSLPIVSRDNRDYVGLLELLEPLGTVTARADGSRWRLHYNHVLGEFQAGKDRARVQGRDADLTAKFQFDGGRGLVAVSSLPSLLPRFLGGPVTLHEESDRLFIGSVATHFTASLAGQNPPRLVFQFTSAVSPAIATQPGTVRMTFARDPVVAPASPTLTFGNKTIPSAIYNENNGAAVIVVNSTVALAASISPDGHTVTLAPTSATAQNAPPSPAAQATAATSAPSSAPAAASSSIPRRYFAVVDAAHGGDDRGEALSSTLAEKDVTLALARSLRQQLESRGIATLVLRDSDATTTLDQRAIMANTTHPAVYIALHAASSGRGVRVYTALLPSGTDDRGPFRAWTTAQRAAIGLSQATATAVAAELQKRQVPNRTLSAPLRPLNNLTIAAVAVEVAPQSSDVQQLVAPDYQELVTGAVASAIVAAHDQLGAAP